MGKEGCSHRLVSAKVSPVVPFKQKNGGDPLYNSRFLILYFFPPYCLAFEEDGGGPCSLILWLGPRQRRAEEGKRGGGNGRGGRTWHRGRALSDRCKKRQENVDGRSVDCCNHSEAGRSVSSVQKYLSIAPIRPNRVVRSTLPLVSHIQ